MRKRILLSLGLFFYGLFTINAQQKTIRGKITSSEDGAALIGVAVAVKGTTVGAITNVEGNYQLSVPESAKTLVVSFVGFVSQEVSIGNAAIIDVKLVVDTKQLSEVVVTAVGIQREKKALGYSVSTIRLRNLLKLAAFDGTYGIAQCFFLTLNPDGCYHYF